MFISVDTLQDWIQVLERYDVEKDNDGYELYTDLNKIREEMEEMVDFVLGGIEE